MALALFICVLAVWAWQRWINVWTSSLADRFSLPVAWFEPAFFGLISFFLIAVYVARLTRLDRWRTSQQLAASTSGELEQLFGLSLPGNRFFVWNWQANTFDFAKDWLQSFGFASTEQVGAYHQNRTGQQSQIAVSRPLNNWEQLLHPEDALAAKEDLRNFQQLASTGAYYTGQYRISDSQGKYHSIQVKGRAATGAGGIVLGLAVIFQDITEQQCFCEQLEQQKNFSEGLINSAEIFVLQLDVQGRILRFNPFAEKITGYLEKEVLGKSWIECLFHEAEKGDMRRLFEHVKTNHAFRQKKASIVHKDGHEIELIWHYQVSTDRNDKAVSLTVIGMDVTDRRVLEKQLYQLAFFDRLTGLCNQARLDQHLQNMIRRRTSREESLTVVYFDIDHFKHVNDALGYAAGDDLLRWIADQLRQLIKEPDAIARLGEDEFVLLLSTYRTERSVKALVHELQRILRQPWQRENQRFEISISVGVSFFPQHGSDFKTLLQHASIALFEAKDRGRNQVCFYDHQMYVRNLRYIDQVNQLNDAIRDKQFVLHFQLQYDLYSGEARGAEALIRWQHPQRGLIAPHSFIPLAEAAGCIDEISKWVLEEASKQKRLWNEQGLAIEKIAVNLSSYSFRLHDLASIVANVLEQSELPGDEIELEITESALLDNIDDALEKIDLLQKQGITFVLDDFGTGYSSLTYLRQLPVRIIKIDRTFVRTMTENRSDAMIIKAIIDLAHDLGLSVVAEGIETIEQMVMLQQYNCDYGQGYLFHHPQPAGQIILHELGHPAITQSLVNK